MPEDTEELTVLIASYLEPEHVERIRQVDPKLNVIYEPNLLRPPRYAADHVGNPIPRTPEAEQAWRSLLAQADILFDFDYTNLYDLPDLAPNVRWIQATSAGIGQSVRRYGYATRMPDTIFTTASGVHAQPLAEFALMAIFMFSRNMLSIQEQQSRKHWERLAGTDSAGRTLGIVGMGKIGRAVAKLAKPAGMRVLGYGRSVQDRDPADLGVDELFGPGELDDMLRQSEYLVLCVPHTDETEQLIGAHEFATLPEGAIVINIARGQVVDEAALIEALRSGHLGGAALDVFQVEPLPVESPLWDMPTVLVSPHSASTSDRENARLTDIFCANLRAYLDGAPMQNVLDPDRLY
jgi:glyoxylate/hydroxypyruvate reductase A